ncbi:tetratricopeptide repeat protein [Acinetobacter sp. YH01020]|uniref:tetratricopeptide repeat protein n=1 Tax=Acinetobacter sp. YH01020 TaxID=2601034 RepID=UPI0035A3B26C
MQFALKLLYVVHLNSVVGLNIMMKYFFVSSFMLFLLTSGCTNTKKNKVVSEDTNYVYMNCEISNEYGTISCGRIPISIYQEINSKFLPNCNVNVKNVQNKDKECLESNKNRPADAYVLGNLKFYGESIEQNEQESMQLIDYAISNQYPEAIFWLAQQNQISGGDINQTVQLLEQSAELGNPLAIHGLGVWYSKGIGVEKDLDKALVLLNKSKKYIPASYSAIALIDFEKGDVDGFINKNNIAIQKGFLFALVDLSALYLGEIQHMENYRDLNKANEMSNKLISNDIAVGYMIKAKILQENSVLTPNQEICDLYKKSYEKGYLDSGLSLGSEYLSGKNCSKNYSAALNIFNDIFDNGSGQTKILASSNLGYMYLNGLGVNRDLNKSKEYLKYAKNYGFQPAIDMLNNLK